MDDDFGDFDEAPSKVLPELVNEEDDFGTFAEVAQPKVEFTADNLMGGFMQDYASVNRQTTDLSQSEGASDGEPAQDQNILINQINAIFESKTDFQKLKSEIQAQISEGSFFARNDLEKYFEYFEHI